MIYVYVIYLIFIIIYNLHINLMRHVYNLQLLDEEAAAQSA